MELGAAPTNKLPRPITVPPTIRSTQASSGPLARTALPALWALKVPSEPQAPLAQASLAKSASRDLPVLAVSKVKSGQRGPPEQLPEERLA